MHGAASLPSHNPPDEVNDADFYFDVAANLTDDMYRGVYHGKKYHEPDLQSVLQRAYAQKVTEVLVTAGSLEQSQEAVALVRASRQRRSADAPREPQLYCTVGVHPTRCGEFFAPATDTSDVRADAPAAQRHLEALRQLLRDAGAYPTAGTPDLPAGAEPLVVAIGECGLDFVRTEFCDISTQRAGFQLQLQLVAETGLPLYLHNRNSTAALLELLERHPLPAGGVVHSFDGTAEEAQRILQRDLYIGINGCSLKTQQNLQVVRDAVPLDRLLLETDCPYCDVRPSHASFSLLQQHLHHSTAVQQCWGDTPSRDKKKFLYGAPVRGRNEPCTVANVCRVVALLKGVSARAVARAAHRNARRLFLGASTVRQR
ncbi:hypothetical protein CDCA_CDCA04G1413 [Cyanidium caldarium]|uniref:Uncharacterized protein n=1 Tax=Cyanidium caldarium TaxID=2771 RepID=A0AAV9ITI4_CYACA|nr:hypothetical protein CDCA_CDCA04G1413 [Cyanidium caldarium]